MTGHNTTYVYVTLNWTLRYQGETRGPGKDVKVSRNFAKGLGLEYRTQPGQVPGAEETKATPKPTTPVVGEKAALEKELAKATRAVLEEKYEAAVEAGTVREIPPGAGSGSDGAVVKDDLVKALAGTFEYPAADADEDGDEG